MTLGGFKRALLAITVLGFVLRFGCLQIASPVRITGDEVYFSKVAANIANGNGHVYDDGSRASWPPGNAYYMSWFVDPEKADEGTAGLVRTIKMMMIGQTIMGTIVVPLVMMLAVALFDRRTAMVAGVITALYPTFVAYSHYLWAANVFVVLTVAGLVAGYHAQRASGFGLVVLTGALFGLAALTRETGLVIAAACGLWWVWCSRKAGRRQALLRAGLMLMIAVLVVVPWTVRNHRVLGGFIPIGTASWMAMAEGNIFDPDDWLRPNRDVLVEFRTSWRRIQGEVARMEFSRKVAIESIRKEQPTWILKKLVRTSGLLFSPDSFLFKKISRGAYGDLSINIVRTLLAVTVASYLFVALTGIVGISIVPNRSHRLLPLLITGSIFVVHLAAFSSSRYRLPVVALLIPYTAHAVLHWREIPRLLGERRWIIPVLVLIWFLALCVPYFFEDAISLWTQGTYLSPWRP